MKKKLFLSMIIIFATASSINAQQFSFDAAYSSRYIWRGFELVPNNKPAIQPSITYKIPKFGLWLNLWGSFAFIDRDLTKASDEFDISIGFSKSLPGKLIELSAGFIYYTFPNAGGDNTSPELNASIAFSRFPLSPSLTLFYDMNLGTGLYALADFSQSLLFTPITLRTTIGYNSSQFIDGSGISNIVFSAVYDLSIGVVSLSPGIYYSYIPMDRVNIENEIWFSLGFGTNF